MEEKDIEDLIFSENKERKFKKNKKTDVIKKEPYSIKEKIEKGAFATNRKFFEKEILDEFCNIYDYVCNNPNVMFMGEYYRDPNIIPTVSCATLKTYYGKFPLCEEIRLATKAIIEERVAKGAMGGKINPGFAKFFLMNHYGWAEKTTQEVSFKAVKFEFGNEELNESENENMINI